MIIPKTFTIFGHEYRVVFVDTLDSKDSVGECLPMQNEIRIKKEMHISLQEQTYLHEIIHCILTSLSYSKLNNDEVFVDQMAQCLHQILKSSKY